MIRYYNNGFTRIKVSKLILFSLKADSAKENVSLSASFSATNVRILKNKNINPLCI